MDASTYLAEAAPSPDRDFVVTRTFDAPRDLVWKAWTERDRLALWWGPKGFAAEPVTLDLRPGGLFHYRLRSPDGHGMWGRFLYREIAAPERIVFVSSFSDEAGHVTRAPFSPHWPLEIVNVLTLAEEDGRTTVTLRGGPIDATDEERLTFEGFFDSMRQGWGGTWDQLAEYLAKARHAPSEAAPSPDPR